LLSHIMHVICQVHGIDISRGDMWFVFLIGTKLTYFESLELYLVVN
jgi:hypothetical protein